MPFYSNPYWLIYSDSRFTADNFGVAWGDVNGDGKSELLVAPFLDISQSVFLHYSDGTFVDAGIQMATPFINDNDTGLAIYDLNGDGKAEVLQLRQNINPDNVLVWGYSDNQLRRMPSLDITLQGLNATYPTDIDMVSYQGQIYIFVGVFNNQPIEIFRLSDRQGIRLGAFSAGL